MFLADTKDLVKSTDIVRPIQQKHHITDILAQNSKLKSIAKTEKNKEFHYLKQILMSKLNHFQQINKFNV